MSALRVSLVVGVVAVLAGCGCPEPVADVDTSSSSPRFSWPDGDAYQLTVTGPDGVYWALQCGNGQNCISSPTRYGDVPPAGVENVVARQLDRGAYEVRVCPLCEDVPRCGVSTFEIE